MSDEIRREVEEYFKECNQITPQYRELALVRRGLRIEERSDDPPPKGKYKDLRKIKEVKMLVLHLARYTYEEIGEHYGMTKAGAYKAVARGRRLVEEVING